MNSTTEAAFTGYVAGHWEQLCRDSVSGNKLYGHRWGEASRWWGTALTDEKGIFKEMEFDVMAESTINILRSAYSRSLAG